ncbi:MAG: cupin domain-containing protein [Gammaproteobacteria bacterium]|nr:cupin domain-containing protein [Gammaproteobacteria bacterium]
MDPINGDLTIRAAARTSRLEWSPSPSRTVWRKRVHRVGPAEAGQVTSVVRYEPGATFPAHDHPDGEEILVLEGVFSDEHGDWMPGTYLLNPEGFRHAPFSRDGCLLFVKLRQYPGRNREHVVLQTYDMDWVPAEHAGVDVKPLYRQPGFTDEVRLERWRPGATPGRVAYPGGAEIFVLRGDLSDETGRFETGDWLRLPAGARHEPSTEGGCTFYIKRGGLAYLLAGGGGSAAAQERGDPGTD